MTASNARRFFNVSALKVGITRSLQRMGFGAASYLPGIALLQMPVLFACLPLSYRLAQWPRLPYA